MAEHRNPSRTITTLIAGATGVIGSRLVPALVARGHRVVALSRSRDKAESLLAMGALPIVCDVYDADRLTMIVRAASPDLVVHQLTDLPRRLDAARMEEGIRNNARVRREGTRNLVAAALAARVPRMIAQSIAWAYRPGAPSLTEDAPLDLEADGLRAVTVAGVAALEQAVLQSPSMQGVVLRYGRLYGPGTGSDAPADTPPVLHVDDAVEATLRAIDRAEPGVYNVVADGSPVSAARAKRAWDWTPR